MTRIRNIGIKIGDLPTGKLNCICDVEGTKVGHVDIGHDGLRTGITAVVPPRQDKRRKLFIGRYGVKDWDGMTGLSVAEDFGTFSSPIVLTSSASVGVVYNACITYGHKRESGLPIDAGWPPVVIGLDDSYLNDPEKEREIKEDILFECFQKAQGEKVEEGNVGIGRGLCAFGLKGGIGQSSRRVLGYTVGVLVASNGGIRRSLTVDGVPVGRHLSVPQPEGIITRSIVAITATDAPLTPKQLDHLSEMTGAGLIKAGFIDAYIDQGLIVSFSTSNSIDAPFEDQKTYRIRSVPQEDLYPLFDAAIEAAQESGLNSLTTSKSAEGKDGRTIEAIPQVQLTEIMGRYRGTD